MAIYKNGKNKNYYYTFQHKKKRYQGSTGTSNGDEAWKIYLEKKDWITRNKLRYIDKTWGDLVAHYIDSYHPNDQRVLIWTLRFFKDTKLEDLTGPDFKSLQEYRLMRVKGSTVNRQFSVIKSLLRKAEMDLGWLQKAPNWRKEQEHESQCHILTLEEEARLLVQLPTHTKRIVQFALETGVRKGTISKLTFDMYDKEKKELSIPANIMKTGKSLVIPVTLKAHELIMNEEFHWNSGLGLRIFNQRRPIFTYKYKRVKEPASNAWRKALKRAKIKMKFHDLRHTWATRLIEQGMSPAYVQYLGGWSSSKMMQRYTHINTRNLELKKYGY